MAAGRPARKPRRGFTASGTTTIPSRGPLAALTVPGAVGGWMLALEAAQGAFGGTGLPLDVLLGAAIRQAREGYVVTHEPGAADRRRSLPS